MILDLVFAAGLLVWGLGVGLAVMGWCGGSGEGRCSPGWDEAVGMAVPLGLGLLGLAVLGLGVAGWLTTTGLVVVLAGGGVVGVKSIVGSAIAHRWFPIREVRNGGPYMGWLLDVALVVGLVGTLLTAMQPVTDGDALCYHLQVPKVFLLRHRAVYEPDLHETVYPLVAEMLDAVALAFRGPRACRLVSWIFGLGFAASTTALARPVMGSKARWAGAVGLLAPAVSNGMGAPLNDVVLAACCNAALLALVRWWERPTVGKAALVGLLCGVAVGVKYPALVWTGLVGVVMVGRGLRALVGSAIAAHRTRIGWYAMADPTKGFCGHVLAFGLAAVLVGGWWYGRAYMATGNPVHPFFRGVFGAGIDEVLDPVKRPLEVTAWGLATALGPMSIDPERFDSLSHQFGPVFLLFLPTGLVLLRAPRRVWAVVGFGWAFLTLCLTQRQSMRFVLAALGPFSVGVAWSVAEWGRRGGLGRVVAGVLVVILLGESGLAVARSRHGWPVLTGRESAEEWLARREPTYVVGQWIGENLPENARVVGQDHRGFYIPRAYSMELAHRRRTGLGQKGETGGQIVRHFREQGFTHLMLCPPEPEDAVEFDPTLNRRLEQWLKAHRPVYEKALSDADGVVRRYAIYELAKPERVARSEGARR